MIKLEARQAHAGAHLAALRRQSLAQQRRMRCLPGKRRVAVVRHRFQICARGPRRPLQRVMREIRAATSAAGGVRPNLDQSKRMRMNHTRLRAWHAWYAGVLSSREKAARRGSHAGKRDPQGERHALFTIAPDGKLTEAVSVMAENNMGSLVVMEKGRMVGILTFREILAALDKGRGALGEVRVGEIMERDPVIASPGMEVNDLRRTMVDSGARYLPVMERDRLIGVISFRDVAKAVLEEQDFENRMLKGYIKNWPE